MLGLKSRIYAAKGIYINSNLIRKPAHIIINTKIADGTSKWYLEDCSDTNTYDSIMDLLVQSPECDTHAFAGSVVENTWFVLTPLAPPKHKSRTLRRRCHIHER